MFDLLIVLCRISQLLKTTFQGPDPVSELYPHSEAEPRDPPEGPRHVLGLHLTDAHDHAPGLLPLLGPGHAQRIQIYERVN